MFRIRRVYDEVLPVNRAALEQVKAIMRSRFAAVPAAEIDQLGRHLHDPFLKRFRTTLSVAEDGRRRVLGFAVLLHEPRIRFCYLDWIATRVGRASGGVGGALYERVRQEAAASGAQALFFECLPDDSALCPQEALLPDNRARLRFYERYGARPIIGTAYETPYKAGQTCMPYLMFDGLDRTERPGRDFMRAVARTILERKYAGAVPPEYVEKVVASITEDPVRLREFRYLTPASVAPALAGTPCEKIVLVFHDQHAIHHVHERGYVEAPARVRSILSEIAAGPLFDILPAAVFPEKLLLSVHDADFVNFLRRTCAEIQEDDPIYPYVFPIRNKARPPKDRSVLAGYFCIDTFTPITRHAYAAARGAVNCTLTAAQELIHGRRMAYALVRPPGHHAERRAFGGFCYFNNTAIAAQFLRRQGRVAILDIDYHHGNGQQEIFYDRPDVLTVSIHGDPSFAYPYFSGFRDEIGSGEGAGFNLNLPLPEAIDGERYRKALATALRRIANFDPDFLVVALGLDAAKGDPTGTWTLTRTDFRHNGRMIGELGIPVLVVQEGGYRTRTLGMNARAFFEGLSAAHCAAAPRRRAAPPAVATYRLRHHVEPQDPQRVRRLAEATGFFSRAEVIVAEELVLERIAKGAASGYHFVFMERNGQTTGYACYGPVPMTVSAFDLYWIVVAPDNQGKGLGRMILMEVERLIRQAGGATLYADTSGRPQYASTRAFYERTGFRTASVLEDFYAPGDSKVIYA
ncbi:MAG: GNAT family N-acetyltransferase, partial [Desulfobacterales bacterium]|nr:GNAT family N-acetyltransferase [Desulfobacterales bacterium]